MQRIYTRAAGDHLKVPSYKQMKQVMHGRADSAWLQSHHTATRQWTEILIPGITDADIDDMPAILLNRIEHGSIKGSGGFHDILAKQMKDVDIGNRYIILERLLEAYSLWDLTNGPGIGSVAESWLRAKGF